MGITEDLNLVGNNFTNAATALWIAVVLAELPNSMCIGMQWLILRFSLLLTKTASGEMALLLRIWLGIGNCLSSCYQELRRPSDS